MRDWKRKPSSPMHFSEWPADGRSKPGTGAWAPPWGLGSAFASPWCWWLYQEGHRVRASSTLGRMLSKLGSGSVAGRAGPGLPPGPTCFHKSAACRGAAASLCRGRFWPRHQDPGREVVTGVPVTKWGILDSNYTMPVLVGVVGSVIQRVLGELPGPLPDSGAVRTATREPTSRGGERRSCSEGDCTRAGEETGARLGGG